MSAVRGYKKGFISYYDIELVDDAEQEAAEQIGKETVGHLEKSFASTLSQSINNLAQQIRRSRKHSNVLKEKVMKPARLAVGEQYSYLDPKLGEVQVTYQGKTWMGMYCFTFMIGHNFFRISLPATTVEQRIQEYALT